MSEARRWVLASRPEVTVADPFWTPRRQVIHEVSLPEQWERMRASGHFAALAARRPEDLPAEPHIFWESDIAKWIEAASWVLADGPDGGLAARIDEAIGLLAGAQQPDGYLNVYYTLVHPERRFTDLRDGHELYCLGHLIEAAVAHRRATGKDALLRIVRRYADLVDGLIRPGAPLEGGYDGHPEVELALLALAEATGEERYRALSRRMLDARGTEPYYFEVERARRAAPGYFDAFFPDRPDQPERYRQYLQAHLPIREQSEAVGHAVRATYLYTAMAESARHDRDASLARACGLLWRDVVERKMYVTGAIGSDPSIEGFAAPYELPDTGGYGETCAAIGLAMWARSMARLTGDAGYADVMELALYNAVLGGVSLDGRSFFYDNPLASDGQASRSAWFDVACCPPNAARTIASIGSYAFSRNGADRIVDLYVAGTARFEDVELIVTADYPRSGSVTIAVVPHALSPRARILVRRPGWAVHAHARVAGTSGEPELRGGYWVFDRQWKTGELIEIDLGLHPRRLYAHPRTVDHLGLVAIARGPLVYCVEEADHPEGIEDLALDREERIHYREGPLPGGALTFGRGMAVPYAFWGNRGTGRMRVWLREAR